MHQGEAKSNQSKSPTVLIVDDEEAVQQVVVTTLNRMGYRTVTADNGLEALEMLQQEPVDLIISDYSMPVVDGLELHIRLKEHSPHLEDRFILITGTLFAPEVSRFIRDNETLFLEKPFRLTDLVNLVEQALENPPKASVAI